MTFDPFQLVPTNTSPELNLAPPKEYRSLVPQLPPNDYKGGQPTVDNSKAFDYFVNKAKVDNAPLYEYGIEEEKRYSNPYLQFNPTPLGGVDTEDIYGKFQGGGEQLWNSLVKTGATAATSFVSSFSTFGDSIDSIRRGKPFDEDSVLGKTQGWLKELENDYPNYYTEWEREHPYLSALPFSGGFTNFWGDKVLKNVGFTVGSLASSLLVDAGIEAATGGGATPASFILAANQIKTALSPLKNAFRNLSKVSALNKVDDLMGVARVGEGINEGLKGMNQAYNLKKALQFAGTTYFAAQGESMIEGYQQYYQTKADLYKQQLDKGTLTPDKIGEIEQTAQEVGNITTALNLPIIMASNLLQFPTIFGGKNILKQFDSPFLEVVNKEGLTVVNNYSRKQAWVNTMKEITKDFISEGGEEGYQTFVGNSVHDYYLDKFNGTATSTLSQYLGKQLPKQINNEQFWESFVIGGISGGLMGAYTPVKTNLYGKERTDKAVQSLQPIYDRFNSAVKDYVHFAENLEFSGDENSVNQFQAAHKALFSTVHDSLKYGIYENFQDSLNDLRYLPVDEYNKLFGTEYNEQQKLNQINFIQKESTKIKSDLTEVNKFFQKNPFDSPYVSQRLQDLYKVDQTQAKNIQAKLFEDYKELTSYNISRLRNTRGKISEIETELKTIGLEDSILPILYNLDSKEGANQYKRFKAIQLNTLKDEIDYYKELEQPTTELNLKVNNLDKLINELDKYDRDFKEGDKEKLRQLIFNEELGERQLITEESFVKKQEELVKQQDIAVNTSQDLETQTTKPEEKVKEMVETVAKITSEPVEVKPPATNKLNTFNKNFGTLKVGDQFELALSTEQGVFTLTSTNPVIATKDGISYQFRPNEVIKYDNGEQKLRYALDNIGVKVVQPTPVVETVEPTESPEPEVFVEEIPAKVKQTVSTSPGGRVEEVVKEKDEIRVTKFKRFRADGRETSVGYKGYSPEKFEKEFSLSPESFEIFNDIKDELKQVKVIEIRESDTAIAVDVILVFSDGQSVETTYVLNMPVKGTFTKETISKQQKLKNKIESLKTTLVNTEPDGIYLIDGDYQNAYRIVDENTVVPLPLTLKGSTLSYDPNLTKGVSKQIRQGYLIDDSYIKGIDITELLEEQDLEFNIDDLLSQESLKVTKEKEQGKGLTLSEAMQQLKNKELNQSNNLTSFINNQQISPLLRSILESRLGKGIQLDC